MIIDICIVKATRSQKPDPNHCALCIAELPVASVAAKTMATASTASANASGNQRSNQSDSRRPAEASRDCAGVSSTWDIRAIYQGVERGERVRGVRRGGEECEEGERSILPRMVKHTGMALVALLVFFCGS